MSCIDNISTRSKKRARVKGTRIDNSPEIKIWNAGFKADYYPTSVLMVSNCVRVGNNNRGTGWGCWCPMELQMPDAGDNPHQHIGRKINIKWLRFKGYIRTYQKLMLPARWRLVLYRADFPMQDLSQNASQLSKLWLNYEDPLKIDSLQHIDDIHTACCHNFYKLIKDVDFWRLHNVSRTVLASGICQPPPWRDPQGYYSQVGSTSAFGKTQHSTGFWHGWYVNDYINAKVNLNDTYTFPEQVQDSDGNVRTYAASCYYAIQLETDQGLGITGVVDTNFMSGAVDNFSVDKANRLFELNFFIRGYYTDA